jgi:carbonic anhydrase
MRKILYSIGLACAFVFNINTSFAHNIDNLSADEALKKLKQGNRRFVQLHQIHPDANKKRRKEMLKGQHPFVIILSCSDSRVPPELIFDQGLGDIFEMLNCTAPLKRGYKCR